MLIITVETHPANVNFLLGGPLAGPAVGELARTRLSLDLMCVVSVDGAGHEFPSSGSRSAVLRLEGTLRAPVDSVLRYRVESLLQGGVRRVLLDLSGVSNIDAAGVGELIHLYNTAAAAGGVLEIGRMNPYVHRVLDVAGVLDLLDVENPAARSTCP